MSEKLHVLNVENPEELKTVIHIQDSEDNDVLNPLTVTPYTRDSETFFQNLMINELDKIQSSLIEESEADKEDDETLDYLFKTQVYPKLRRQSGTVYLVGDKWENICKVKAFMHEHNLSPLAIFYETDIPQELEKDIEELMGNDSLIFSKCIIHKGIEYSDEYALLKANISIATAYEYIRNYNVPDLKDCEKIAIRTDSDNEVTLTIRLNDLAILPSPDITEDNYVLGYITPIGIKCNNLGLATTLYRGGSYVMQRCGECMCKKLCEKPYLSDNKATTGDIMLPDNKQCYQEKARLIADYIIGNHFNCLGNLTGSNWMHLEEAVEWLRETEPMLYAYCSYQILKNYSIKESQN